MHADLRKVLDLLRVSDSRICVLSGQAFRPRAPLAGSRSTPRAERDDYLCRKGIRRVARETRKVLIIVHADARRVELHAPLQHKPLGPQGLVLERRVQLDAARISVHDYQHFARFARNASDALSAEVIIALGSGS